MILDNLAPEYCIPFIIGDGPSLSGSRIGGAPPEGVSSMHSEEAHYLLTLALEENGGGEVSIFLHYDWQDIKFDHSRTLFGQEEAWVELVVHGPSVRRPYDQARPLLTPHPLLIKSVTLDQDADETSEPLWEHKLGGRPYFVRHKPKFVDAIEGIEQSGYRQFLQLTFPGPKDAAITGDWPFADGVFYVFFSHDGANYRWYYGWMY